MIGNVMMTEAAIEDRITTSESGLPTTGCIILAAAAALIKERKYQLINSQNGVWFNPVIRVKSVNLTLMGDDDELIATPHFYRTVLIRCEVGTPWESATAALSSFVPEFQAAILAEREKEQLTPYLRVCKWEGHSPPGPIRVNPVDDQLWECERHNTLLEEDTYLVLFNPFPH